MYISSNNGQEDITASKFPPQALNVARRQGLECFMAVKMIFYYYAILSNKSLHVNILQSRSV